MDKGPVLGEISGAVAHILAQIESTAANEVIEQLATDISVSTADETRDFMFHEAVKLFANHLKQANIDKMPKMQLIHRRGHNRDASCKDIVNLFMYVAGFTSNFPRETLSVPSKASLMQIPEDHPNGLEVDQEASTGQDATRHGIIEELHKKLALLASECKTLKQDLDSEIKKRENDSTTFLTQIQELKVQIELLRNIQPMKVSHQPHQKKNVGDQLDQENQTTSKIIQHTERREEQVQELTM